MLKKLPKINFVKMIKNYQLNFLKSDFAAGISIATLSLPQNMAYALIAGVNPVYGIYTSIVAKVVATFVGSSSYMVVGPTNLMAMAIASNLNFVQDGNYLQAVLVLTFLVGVFQLLFGLFQLGGLVNYISHPVIVGLTTGTALIIAGGQLGNLVEISTVRGSNLFANLYLLVKKLGAVNLLAALLGSSTIILILVSERLAPRLPAHFLGVTAATLAVYFFNLEQQVSIVGQLPASLPTFDLIEFDLEFMSRLFTKAVAVAIVGLIQTLAVVKSLENRAEEEIDINNEFIGQGIINLIAACYNGFASAGSFTNSFLNYQLGAKSRFAELISAVIIGVFIVLFNPFVKYIPIASLAGLVILVAVRMINKQEILEVFRATEADTLIFVVTFLATVLLPRLEQAVYLGVLISLIVVLKESSKANVEPMSYDEDVDSKLAQKKAAEIEENEYIVINLAGSLNFSAAENFKQELDDIYVKGRPFVIRVRNMEGIDLTSVKELEKFINRVQENGGEVMLSGVKEENYETLKDIGIISQIGEENVFFSKEEVFASTRDAVESVDEEE